MSIHIIVGLVDLKKLAPSMKHRGALVAVLIELNRLIAALSQNDVTTLKYVPTSSPHDRILMIEFSKQDIARIVGVSENAPTSECRVLYDL